MNETIEELSRRVELIESRNRRVEGEKGWETSVTRFLCVVITTYITMNLILWSIGGPFPPVHAFVPTAGYVLSTLTFSSIKRRWLRRRHDEVVTLP